MDGKTRTRVGSAIPRSPMQVQGVAGNMMASDRLHGHSGPWYQLTNHQGERYARSTSMGCWSLHDPFSLASPTAHSLRQFCDINSNKIVRDRIMTHPMKQLLNWDPCGDESFGHTGHCQSPHLATIQIFQLTWLHAMATTPFKKTPQKKKKKKKNCWASII